MEEIRSAFRLFWRGERTEGRGRLMQIWERLGAEGDVFHRSVTAHFLADTQDSMEAELEWDLRALEVAMSLDDRTAEAYPLTAMLRRFLPSLHLNLADDYRRMGDFEKARHHAALGNELSVGLGFDTYSQTVREGLVRVEAQIEQRDSGPSVVFDFDQ